MILRTKILILVMVVVVISGCVTAPKMHLKSHTPPKIQYCVDAIGHIEGWSPWILGGKCCCTPTKKMFDVYLKEGTVAINMTYRKFLNLFKEKGIVTDLDSGYKGSNNRDDHSPHVVFGGKSMVTPTPGTDNYEEVISGKRKAKPKK